ncbi:3-oxoacyl-[acyl-carrier-protein] reductase [Thioclava sp. L04-15]|uniref:SDR family oxidoreductase n=1 Tax=Thioclava sp. L04-15 TaxID=1915318 RepID=UPI0009983473|nr:SDR family oxidoreductase [Thioclava sp. L04-15]OOY26378.1 3-oxoacyl-[acyl-carrier-protein] reductase [Thioclava sp. L04-15]TNE89882.1 MAG: SDR family oxidoreductase [Paracoccaceae bacterium]
MIDTSRMKLPGLEGKRVAVTAGGSGIGLCIARELSRQGARLAICDIDEGALERAADELGAEVALRADVSDEAAVASFFKTIGQKLGGLDALVNNAGIAGPTGSVDEISPEDWRRCLDIGLTGQFLCTRKAVPMLRAAGGGAIVNISSSAGKFGYAFRTPYASAKWGVIGFTQSLAKELGPENIRANAILPGIIEGPRIEGVIAARAKQTGVSHEEMTERYLSNVSLRRMTPPEDVADMAAFLIADTGRNLSGQSFPVDGNVETL